jgi:hypothetical protein
MVFLLTAIILLGSMRARPWTAAGKTTLGNITSKQLLMFLLATGILTGPATSTLMQWAAGGSYTGTLSPLPWTACVGVLTSYPAFAAFRSMIPGSRGDIGDSPPYHVAARGPVFGLLAMLLVSAPLLIGGIVTSRSWDDLRSSLAHGEYLSQTGTLEQVRVTLVEIDSRYSVWFEEHDVFSLGGGELFEAVCSRRANELGDNGSYTCLRANIGDELAVAYREKASQPKPTLALQVRRNTTNHS